MRTLCCPLLDGPSSHALQHAPSVCTAAVLRRAGRLVLAALPLDPSAHPAHSLLGTALDPAELAELAALLVLPAAASCLRAVVLLPASAETPCAPSGAAALLAQHFPLLEHVRSSPLPPMLPPPAPSLGLWRLATLGGHVVSVLSVGDEEHPALRPLLFWIRDSQPEIVPTDLQLHRPLPAYLRSPLCLVLCAPSVSEWPDGTVLKLCRSDAPLGVFAHCTSSEDRRVLQIIEPAFSSLFLKHEARRSRPPDIPATPTLTPTAASPTVLAAVSLKSQSSQRRASISLSNWSPTPETPPQSSDAATSSDRTSLRAANKNILKKLMLLSLRHVGVDKTHPEFASIWKHLYCGCLFALRRDLALGPIDQPTMLAVIRSNINFLNVK